MGKNKYFINISDKNVNMVKVNKNNIKDIEIKSNKKFLTRFLKRKVSVILEGEEIFIKYFTLPKNCKRDLAQIIKNKLQELYGETIDNVLFSYHILNENFEEFNIIVYCINSEKIQENKTVVFGNYDVIGLSLIQYYFITYHKKDLVKEKFIFIFKYNEFIYLQYIDNDAIKSNYALAESKDCYRIIYQCINSIYSEFYENKDEKVYIYSSLENNDEIDIPIQMSYEIIELNDYDKRKLLLEIG
jgi:flavodoxin